jgi:hypothetical protein
VNEALAGLAQAREDNDWSVVNQLQKNLAFHLSGHVLLALLAQSHAEGDRSARRRAIPVTAPCSRCELST